MRRGIIIGVIILLGIAAVVAVNEQEKNKKECKEVCIDNFINAYGVCKGAYETGKDSCKKTFDTCKDEAKTLTNGCLDKKNDRNAFKECMKQGSDKRKACEKEHKTCDKGNRDTFLGCLKEGRKAWETCREACKKTEDDKKECEKQGGTWNNCEGQLAGCVPICELKTCTTKQECISAGLKKNIDCIDGHCKKAEK